MTNGQRSSASRMWNAGHPIDRIANRIGVSYVVAEAFLEGRLGFPGKIESNSGYYKSKKKLPEVSRIPGRPTLPRLKCLEGSDE